MNRKTQSDIKKSIDTHSALILKDMSLGLRLANDEGHTYLSALIKWEEDEIIFEAPIEKRDWVIFPLPINLHLWFITKQNVFETRIHVIARQQVEHKLLYKAKLIAPLTKNQQRAHFRLATLFPVSYKALPEKDYDTSLIESLPLDHATAVNISVGGICMVCDKQLEAGQYLLLTFDFLENTFKIYGEILQPGSQNESGTFSHRIRFVKLDPAQENLLGKSIFEKQRLLMRSSKKPLFKK